MSEEKKKPKRNKYLRDVTKIQDAAINTNLPNCVSRELEYQQALSVLLRSRQLIREGGLHPNRISTKIKAEQIDKCYEQRENRRRR
jgi:hypothetical protein